MAHSVLDNCAGAAIRAIHGEKIARQASYGIDIVWQKLTVICDRLTGVPSHRLYAAVDDNDGSGYRPVSIAMARKFRRKFILPRRRLERRSDGGLQWKRLAPGEDTARSRRYVRILSM